MKQTIVHPRKAGPMFICSAYKIIRRKEKPQITANVSGGDLRLSPLYLMMKRIQNPLCSIFLNAILGKGNHDAQV